MTYNKYMPYGHLALTWTLFYGLPVISIGWYFAARITTDVSSLYVLPLFTLYVITEFLIIVWYDDTIHVLVHD